MPSFPNAAPITVDELLAVTPAWCAQVRAQSVMLGGRLRLTFESRQSLLARLHEIITTEGMSDRAALQAECEVFSSLLPAHDLVATLQVLPAAGVPLHVTLKELADVPAHLSVRAGADWVPAQFHGPFTSHQHVRFAVPPGTLVTAVHLDHPNLRCDEPLDASFQHSLQMERFP